MSLMKFCDKFFRRWRDVEIGRYSFIKEPPEIYNSKTCNNLENLFGKKYVEELKEISKLLWYPLSTIISNPESLLRNLVDFEWLLHTELEEEQLEKKRYRDHITHAVKVAYVGGRLLERSPELFGFDLDEKISGLLERSKEIQEFLKSAYIDICTLNFDVVVQRAWWLASAFHDLGYPIVYFKGVCGKIKTNYPHIFDRYGYDINDVSRIIPGLKRSLLYQVVDRCKIAEAFTSPKCHGVWGATELLFRYNSMGDIDSNTFLAVHLAALAIFQHDFAQEIIFEKEPISFLLLLSDEIQEWGRIFLLVQAPCIENITESEEVVIIKEDFRWKIKFHYLSERTGKTGWKLERACESKGQKLTKLQSGDKFPQICYKIKVI